MKTLENHTAFDPETLTFAQLRALSPATPGGRVPTAKHLLEAKPAVLLQAMVTDTVLTVYTNGYFTALRAGKATVYSVDRCSSIEYRFDDGTTASLNEKDYRNGPWEVPLLLAADMRLEDMQYSEEKYRGEFDMETDGSETRDEFSIPDALTQWLEEAEANEREALHEKRMKALQAALECLTEKQRRVLEMYFFENKSQYEIADVIGIGQRTVSHSLEGGLNRLKKYFEKNF